MYGSKAVSQEGDRFVDFALIRRRNNDAYWQYRLACESSAELQIGAAYAVWVGIGHWVLQLLGLCFLTNRHLLCD